MVMSTDNFRKSGKCNISLLSTGAPRRVSCTEKVALHKEYNLKRHYTTRHAEVDAKYQEMRERTGLPVLKQIY